MPNYSKYAILFLLSVLSSSGFCGVLFEQDFTDPIGHDPSYAEVRSGNLDFKFHQESGNHLWMLNYDSGVTYQLDPSVTNLSVHQTLYISFNIRAIEIPTDNKFAGVILYNNGNEVIGMGNDYASGNFSFWSSGGNGIVIGDVPVAVDSDVHKIVMRIDYNASGAETIKVGLDPFCRRSEARQPDHIWTTYQSEVSFDEIRIRCGNSYSQWEFDELRIATDWASVTPSNDGPGAYVGSLTASPLPTGASEMILGGVARFWPNGVGELDVLPSFVLETPLSSIGSVSPSWELTPLFGTYDNKKYAYIEIPAEVDLYGTGEVTGSLMRNGYEIVLFNKDNYGYGVPNQLYQSHPWVLGVRPDGTAFGIIFDTPWYAELSLRSGILLTVPDEAQFFPVMVIEGASPQEVMTKLGDLSGTMPMPPRWSLGYHQSRYSYDSDSYVRWIADEFRAKQIPCDAIWFDIDYMDEYRVFTFNYSKFPDPPATNAYLQSSGFKSVWMIDPGVKLESGYFVYDGGNAIDAWVKNSWWGTYVGQVWPGDCVFPDFTIPSVRSWWAGLYPSFMANGIDGIWNDMNEPGIFSEASHTMPLDNIHRGGDGWPVGSHEQYHNIYGMQMVRASRDGMQSANPNKRPFVLSRANFLGGHRYAATWTGDNKANWDHFKWSIPMSLNLSLSGQPFNGPDIGGFIGSATADLWANWISVGAFYPFSRAHYDGSSDQEPWVFGTTTENAARVALGRRYRMMPYLYTVFRQAHEEGLPVMRPVLFADPTDISLRMEDEAFLLGQDMLVVPKWSSGSQLPQGIWRSASIVGENAENDGYQCDVKVRGGAIVPLGPIVQSTDEIATHQQLTLMVVLDGQGQAAGTLYEDAGDGYDYLAGDYCLSTFSAQKTGGRVAVTCTQQGNLSLSQRLVTVAVVEDNETYYGAGDVCSAGGVSVILSVPSGWSNQDVGAVGEAGSFSGSGVLTVTGSGSDIEYSADEFQFAYRQITSDCEITARVVNQQDTNDWAKAGVMIRETLDAGSKHAMVVMTPSNGSVFQRRDTTDGGTSGSVAGGVSAPEWVRIKRVGNVFTGYYSADGLDWTSMGSITITMSSSVYFGLAVTSHNEGVLCTATFDNVNYTVDACSLDLNTDGKINLYEFSVMAAEWQTPEIPGPGDFTGDGAVDMEDLGVLLNFWLQGCP
jgi:alpha-glucosidase